MNIIDGDGWEKLCKFLEIPLPKIQFPKKNTRIKGEITSVITRLKYFYDKIKT